MDDKTDDFDDVEYELGDEAANPFLMMNGLFSEFGAGEIEFDDETELAVKMMKASEAVDHLTVWCEQNDVDPQQFIETVVQNDVDNGDRKVGFALMSLVQSMNEFGELLEDDSDENPFRVS